MPGKCSFKEFWLTDEENKYSKWLRPVEDDQYKAYCTFCKSKFDISHSGLNGVKIHGKGQKHLELTSALLQVVGEVEPYLKIFQNDNPMLPFVHAELYSMARSIAARVLKAKVISNVKNSGQLLAIDVKNENLLSFSDVDIGFGAKKFCKNVKELDVQLFRKDCSHFLVEMFQKLTGPRSPLRKCMVKGASCLSPAVMTSGTLRVQRVNIALEQLTSNNHIAYIEAEHIRKNYLEICEQSSVQEELKTFDFNETRLDSFLFNIFINAKACKALLSFCTMIFTMFHGNSAVERGFSVNKECLVENMKERSLISQRSIYSMVQSVGGIKNVEFTSGMLHAARRASSKRREAIEEMKKKESEEANRSKTTLEAVNKLESKKRKLLKQVEEEASALQTEIDLEKKRLRQIESILNEIFAHSILGKHPNILRYHAAWTENKLIYIQNEFCVGGSLKDLIIKRKSKEKNFSQEELYAILVHVSKGLRYIHSLNLAHLNLKSATVLIQKEKMFPLLDGSSHADTGHVTNVENPKLEKGDFRYLPREIQKEDFSQVTKADIFSLGPKCSILSLDVIVENFGDNVRISNFITHCHTFIHTDEVHKEKQDQE
uniref:Protein kinase domain-containing protein n=1 Tax=Timema cristinae TaxID=61476 RepID=A0A7R9CF71_TIMCR|nr:unnamed protein product [Timema cristinae]